MTAVPDPFEDLGRAGFGGARFGHAFFTKQKIDAEFVAKVGPAADTIAALATKGKFDLLMLGSHGHGALGNLVLGSVTTRVMANCGVPVLVIR